MNEEEKIFRAGTVALVGRPNVGKSTLLNALLGQKLAATTHKPQTTRKNLLGVLMTDHAQIALLDTPGHHKAEGPLNRYMVAQAEEGIQRADIVAYMIEARDDKKITPGNQRLLEILERVGKPVVLVINKVDALKNKQGMLHQITAFSEALGELMQAVVPISARREKQLDELVDELGKALPEGPPLFDPELLTDSPERAIVAELIREKVMLQTREELPYAAAVTIDDFEDGRPKAVIVTATIHVERPTQKGIVIGKHGERIKEIGTAAREEAERFLDAKVHLDLHVRVTEEWSSRPRRLTELGYGGES